jgi:hypothetical protein
MDPLFKSLFACLNKVTMRGDTRGLPQLSINWNKHLDTIKQCLWCTVAGNIGLNRYGGLMLVIG